MTEQNAVPCYSVLEGLRPHHLFNALDEVSLLRIATACRIISLKNEESIFIQGADAHFFYLVVSGEIKLFRVSPDGLTKVIEVVRQKETFAEALMFLQQKIYPLNAVSMGESEVIQIPCHIYKELILASPECALGVMGNMALKLHRRINEIETLTLQNTRHRLGNYLFGLLPDPSASSAEVRLPMAKQLIASQLAMQPETFSRLMKEMKTKSIITVERDIVNVLDVEALRNFGH